MIFSLPIRRPSSSTLFPSRRSSDLAHSISQRVKEIGVRMAIGATQTDIRQMILREGMLPVVFGMTNTTGNMPSRSEEHTSELQSRRDLVCRLLLEKKNRNTIADIKK